MFKQLISIFLLVQLVNATSAETIERLKARATFPLVAPTETADCSFCKGLDGFLNQNPQETAKRTELVAQLLGVLTVLGQERDAFIKSGNFTNVFAAAYFHITDLEMGNILSNKYAYPTAKMEMMLSFYDSYRYNRALADSGASRSVEPQWQQYYANAQAYNETMAHSRVVGPVDGYDLYQLINSGIDAHVKYDLPRAIRNTFQSNAPSAVARGQMYAEFKDTNSLFGTALQQANSDIRQAFSLSQRQVPGEGWFMDVSAKLSGAARKVISERESAYQIATTGRDLPTANRPQRTSNRQELREKGNRVLQSLKDACAPCACESEAVNYSFNVHRPVNTGIAVKRGDKMLFEASGEVIFGPSVGSAGPSGKTAFLLFGIPVAIDTSLSLFPKLAHGCLLGRIGGGTWFYVGEGGEMIAPETGVLELNVNDRFPNDNDNDFRVNVKICSTKPIAHSIP